MADAFELLGQLARLVEAVPVAARITFASKQAFVDGCATCGNQGAVQLPDGRVVACPCVQRRADAVRYLTTHGWREGLDVARPGLGSSIAQSIARTKQAATETHAIVAGPEGRHIVDAEFRVLPEPPWEAFQRALADMTWGSIPIFGRRGSGKTLTALRIAQVISQRRGWPVEGVNIWPEDSAAWVQPISADLLVKRVALMRRVLQLPRDEVAAAVEWVPVHSPELEKIKRRVILIDEASLADLSPGSVERRAVVTAMMQARHLDWVVLYVGQLMNQLPRSILTSDVLMFKEPSGDESSFDRDDPAARFLWQQAALSFAQIEGDRNWWRAPFNIPEAWVYVKARAPVRYDGMMPIRMPIEVEG